MGVIKKLLIMYYIIITLLVEARMIMIGWEMEFIFGNKTLFREKTHIQTCVRNPNCIKGYFAPIKEDITWIIP